MNISMDVITQDNCNTDRDACIMAMLDHLGGMISNFSFRFHFEYDECYQQAALAMLVAWPKIPATCTDRAAYLNHCVRNELYQMLKRNGDALSLEQPRADGSNACLADILQATECRRSEDELARIEKVAEVVHAVLRGCRLDEQEYARTAFELTTYTPVAPAKQAYSSLLTQKRRKDNLQRSINRIFFKHPQVQGLLQREKAVL